MKVRDIMTRHVVRIGSEEPAEAAARAAGGRQKGKLSPGEPRGGPPTSRPRAARAPRPVTQLVCVLPGPGRKA